MSDLSDQMIDELQQEAIGHLETIINTLVNAAEKEAAKSRDKIRMLEEEVSFIRGNLPERDRQIDVLRGDLQQQTTTVHRLIEERDEARNLLAKMTQERDHWLSKCKEIEAASWDSELELLAMHIFMREPKPPAVAFREAEDFLAERDRRRKEKESQNNGTV